jgi:hypothetical protein
MKPPRMTTRQLMLAVALVAVFLSPGVIGGFPDQVGLRTWALAMALTNIPPILALPVLFRLDRQRSLIAMLAFAGIAAAQVILKTPANTYALAGYITIAAMARLAKDWRDLLSAIASVAAGLSVGVACGYNPCTPIEVFLAPLTGIIVRVASVRRLTSSAPTTDPQVQQSAGSILTRSVSEAPPSTLT